MPYEMCINTQDILLYDVPAGKKYITDEARIIQSGQKGGDCWKYSHNILREGCRLGNKVETLGQLLLVKEEKEQTGETEVSLVLQYRSIEKAISSYRKQMMLLEKTKVSKISSKTRLCQIEEEINQIKNEKQQRASVLNPGDLVGYDALKYYASIHRDCVVDNLLLQLNQEVEQLKVNQNGEVAYVASEVYEKEIAIHQETLMALGHLNPELFVARWFFNQMKDVGTVVTDIRRVLLFRNHALQAKARFYRALIREVIGEKYGLITSSWKPEKGFEGLVQALQTDNVIEIEGHFGLAYYKDAPKKSHDLGPYETYYWPVGSIRVAHDRATHAITIVGTERVFKSNGQPQNQVLFLDPNFGSNPGKKRKIFRMSYETFIRNLKTSSKEDEAQLVGTKVVYAYRIDLTLAPRLKASYHALVELYIRTVESAIENYKFFRAPVSSFELNLLGIEAALQKTQANPERHLPLLQQAVNAVIEDLPENPVNGQSADGNSLAHFLMNHLAGNQLSFASPKSTAEPKELKSSPSETVVNQPALVASVPLEPRESLSAVSLFKPSEIRRPKPKWACLGLAFDIGITSTALTAYATGFSIVGGWLNVGALAGVNGAIFASLSTAAAATGLGLLALSAVIALGMIGYLAYSHACTTQLIHIKNLSPLTPQALPLDGSESKSAVDEQEKCRPQLRT